MRHVRVTECRVSPGGMTEFVNSVQQWERAALASAEAPEYHAVLVDEVDPAQVLIIEQFHDADHAARFDATGLHDRFLDGVMSCVDRTATSHRGYSLFYADGAAGKRAMFGEEPAR
jgi:hypothetical protein